MNVDRIKSLADRLFLRAEERGLLGSRPTFDRDYRHDYPELATLEAHYDVIRAECESLLGLEDHMVDVKQLAGRHTAGDVHAVRWKSFLLKSGDFVEPNCARAPRTTELVRGIPGVYTAFFSVLGARQHIAPHWGYWKGFLRFHMGVIVPGDNADGRCWLRVNADAETNRLRQRERIAEGETYHWHNGEGVMFDDTCLHEAANESDDLRVVLWLDVRRKMPLYLQALNVAVLEVAHRLPEVAAIRRNAVVRG